MSGTFLAPSGVAVTFDDPVIIGPSPDANQLELTPVAIATRAAV